MSNPGPAGYEVVPLPNQGEGRLRQGAKFTCTRCDNTITIAMPNGKVNPEMLARRAIRFGWRADAFHPSKCRCPEHNPKAPVMAKNEIMDQREDLHALRKQALAAPAAPAQVIPPAPTATTTSARSLTSDEKLKVRGMLDKHFDDSRGVYLEGMSDKKIGELLNIPWAPVAEMREVGWGPIRSNPEMDALRQGMARLDEKIQATEEKVRKAGETFNFELRGLVDDYRKLADKLAKLEG